MSSALDSVLSLAPYHLLSYGTLLGTEIYQVGYLSLLTRGIGRLAAMTLTVISSL